MEGGGAGWAGAYLEGDLCQAPRALDVETEDGQAQVGLVLHRLLARVELLALVDVLPARLTPGHDRGTQAIPAPWFLRWDALAFWQMAAGICPGTGSSLPPEAACLRFPSGVLSLLSAWAWPRGPLLGKHADDPDLQTLACHTLPAAWLALVGHPGLHEGRFQQDGRHIEQSRAPATLASLPSCAPQAWPARLLTVPANPPSPVPPPGLSPLTVHKGHGTLHLSVPGSADMASVTSLTTPTGRPPFSPPAHSPSCPIHTSHIHLARARLSTWLYRYSP